MDIVVKWAASAALVRRELEETGQTDGSERQLTIVLPAVSREQRAELLDLARLGTAQGSLNICDRLKMDQRPYGSFETERVGLDGEPSVDEVIRIAREIAAHNAPIKARRAAEEEAKRTAERMSRELETASLAAIQELAKAGDIEGLRGYRTVEGLLERDRQRVWSALESARRDVASAQREADKRAWVDAHGSEHLKRACGNGYGCQRLYVEERAAQEAPGYVVDFGDKAAWKDRACPSVAALDVEETARGFGLGEPLVVWLTQPPTDLDEDEAEEWEAREAVVIRSYLGKYDLVKEV